MQAISADTVIAYITHDDHQRQVGTSRTGTERSDVAACLHVNALIHSVFNSFDKTTRENCQTYTLNRSNINYSVCCRSPIILMVVRATLKYDDPRSKIVGPRATFSTSGSSYFNVHSLPCIVCIMSYFYALRPHMFYCLCV